MEQPGRIPLWEELRAYSGPVFKGDLQAGLTVGAVLIPQAMAYAMLAGLPPVYGLYASVVPLLVYALLGTSRHLSLGPAALLSLLIASGLGRVAEPGTPAYLQWAIALAFSVGLLQFLLGLFRLGFLVNFLSNPVVSGFTSASAVLIMLSQLNALLGIDLPRADSLPAVMPHLRSALTRIAWPSAAAGGLAVLLLLLVKRFFPRWPGALLVLVLGASIGSLWGAERLGLALLGEVPRGLPALVWPSLSVAEAKPLLPTLLSISLMGYVISIAVARSIPMEKRRYRLQPDRELRAQGLANALGALFQGFPVAGSFARTAVNYQAGAQTGMSGVISAVLVLLVTALLTPLLSGLPLAVLAAIIVVAVADLLQIRAALSLWKRDRRDLLMLLVTLLATLLLGLQTGIVTGVALSLAALLYSGSRPHYAVLGRLPQSNVYRNILRFPEAEEEEGVLILRPEAALFFGNQEYVRNAMELELSQRPETELIIVDGSSIASVDSTALDMLLALQRDLLREGVQLRFLGLNGDVRDAFRRSGLESALGDNPVYARIHDLVMRFREEAEGPESARAVRASSERGG
jgi:sulfate permease, SulP family